MKTTTILSAVLLSIATVCGCRSTAPSISDNAEDEYISDERLLACPVCRQHPLIRKANVSGHFFTAPDDVQNPSFMYGAFCNTDGCLVKSTHIGCWRQADAVENWNVAVRKWAK